VIKSDEKTDSLLKRFFSKGYTRYFTKKIIWLLITLIAATILNFALPRMMPNDPVAAITSRVVGQGIVDTAAIREMYEHYERAFGLDKPVIEQFFIFVGNIFKGDFGLSFSEYPRPVADILSFAIPWTVIIMLPSILVGWILGNILGALAAYLRKGFDKVLMPLMLFVGGIPAFGMAYILLAVFSVNLGWFPIGGAYQFGMIPHFSWDFFRSVLLHYPLPFLSMVLIAIGGQAIGMRSMSIYELNADYVKYSRFLGIKDRKIVGYVFRNAMLPQVTGLALSIAGMIGAGLVAEIVFNYPGLGSTMLRAIRSGDYPLISATTLIITIMVLIMVFILDIIYALIDPRVKSAQYE